ncbi:segregation and condensation protein A [Alicyclobacillus fastidiosus]|uniref:Segregation and condensation protein A n=1 Tax=Alicyclobacillus fastidiosus TaxID=392011 RepID=A0ABV5AHR0_9BACL|nr:segregation/condensation protein A [Alicyclobacillus fastidiosus]WEH11772.1 segregation/condensation protein A [Alicyclobacillus fastidiosus]
MSYEVRLAQFEGPLDLLLHLIRKNEVDIYDIPIAEITDQYLSYLRAMEEWSLEIASEFVVMAATLLAIKSRMLLPRTRAAAEEQEEDPRAPLVEQLIEYQRCKWAAGQLSDLATAQAQVFSRAPMDLSAYKSREAPELTGVSLWNLVDAFRKLYMRMPKLERVAEIRGHVERVEDLMDEIVERLQRYRRIEFSQLMDFVHNRHTLVTAFLAILELIKDRALRFVQEEAFGPLELIWIGETDNDATSVSG